MMATMSKMWEKFEIMRGSSSGSYGDSGIYSDTEGDSESNIESTESPAAGEMSLLDVSNAQYGKIRDFLHTKRARYIAMGQTKLVNVVSAAPADRCIAFVGDSGQGDEIVGR